MLMAIKNKILVINKACSFTVSIPNHLRL